MWQFHKNERMNVRRTHTHRIQVFDYNIHPSLAFGIVDGQCDQYKTYTNECILNEIDKRKNLLYFHVCLMASDGMCADVQLCARILAYTVELYE